MTQTCMVGWIVIASEMQQWRDIALLLGEVPNLHTVRDVILYGDHNLVLGRASM
jgi:hypothetical protein